MDGYTPDMPEADVMSEAQRMSILNSLGASLAHSRDKHINARVAAGIDERWYGDVEAHEGRDEVTRYYAGLRETVQGYVQSRDPKIQQRSRVVVNVTRQKVNAAAARLQDIALPTDDRNWDLRPSTVPELAEGDKDMPLIHNGKPIMVDDAGTQRAATMGDKATLDMEKAKAAAEGMRREIDDQLDLSADGSGFEGVVRRVMFDEALLGVGAAKGPINTSRVKKVWMPVSDGQKTVHVLQRRQDLKPGSARVNPWDIYPHPDCGETPTKFPVWERIPGTTAGDLRRLADTPGYLAEQIKSVLMEGPVRRDQPAVKPNDPPAVTAETAFEMWEYHGDLTREELQAAGCDCSEDDVFTSYSAAVVMVNNTVIKADIEILDTGDMPYDFFVTERRSGSWDGYGTAFLARSAQRVITASWRAMMDNAGWFGGPQIVMNRRKVEPADGQWQLRGPKLWYYNGNDEPNMEHIFAVHNIPSNQAEYANIIKMGMEFLDTETALPQLAQGEQGSATDVLGGMNLLLNASNVLIRRKLKCFDDQFTIPHITRYVDWNMQYSPKPEIKGDFEVQARASGALFDTDVQNRGAANLLALTRDPSLAHGLRKWDIMRRVVRAMRFDPADFVKPDAEIEAIEKKLAEQQQPQDPRIAVAQINAQVKGAELQARVDEGNAEREMGLLMKEIDTQVEIAKQSGQNEQAVNAAKVKLADTLLKLRGQAQMQQQENARQMLQPPTEPKGRAPDGAAFTQ